MADHNYTAETIKSLDWKEHIRLRPGMYIGKLGDGSSEDDGIYVLLKEVLDNCIDEFVMGYGKQIDVQSDGQRIEVRDRGRGIPLEKLLDCSSKINTGLIAPASADISQVFDASPENRRCPQANKGAIKS